MATLSKEELLDAIAAMSVMELSELVKAIEEKFGVSAAAAPMAAMPSSAAGDSTAVGEEEKTAFDVVLKSAGGSKIAVIKVIKGLTGLGLKEAKEMTEKENSVIKEGVSKDEAEDVKKQLEEAGATVEVV